MVVPRQQNAQSTAGRGLPPCWARLLTSSARAVTPPGRLPAWAGSRISASALVICGSDTSLASSARPTRPVAPATTTRA